MHVTAFFYLFFLNNEIFQSSKIQLKSEAYFQTIVF